MKVQNVKKGNLAVDLVSQLDGFLPKREMPRRWGDETI